MRTHVDKQYDQCNSVRAGYVFMHELSRHVCSCMCTAVQGDPKVTQIFQLL